jgi:hypothetical protein
MIWQERILFFVDPDEQWQMLLPTILEHLHALVPVLYMQESTPHDRILDLLSSEGLL